MLQDVDSTLEKLLRETGNIPKKDVDVAFDPPSREWSASVSRPTLNCWCFDVRENLRLRPSDAEMNRYNGNMGRHSLPPSRMDLTYLVTGWARKIEDQHRLTWRALQTFKRYPKLSPSICEGDLRYQSRDIPLWVADMSEPRANMTDLWSVLDNEMRLGFMLILTVELDTMVALESPLVLEATVRVGQAENPQSGDLSVMDVEIVHKHETEPGEED